MVPGPSELHDEDLQIFGRQMGASSGSVWVHTHEVVVELLGRLLDASAPYLIPGTGTTSLDAAVLNLFEPGQRVVVPDTGYFGVRLIEIARAAELDVVVVPVEVGEPVDPDRLCASLGGAEGILVTHVATDTGVRHPLEEIAAVARAARVVLVVDAVASAGGELVQVEAMGIDAVVTASHKGLEGPPGIGVVALSGSARARLEARESRPRSWYLDLKRWEDYRRDWGAWHPHPVTMPANLVRALGSSVGRIMDVGLYTWVARRNALARRCREGLAAVGLRAIALPGHEANLVVAMWAHDPATIVGRLLERGIMVAGGLGPTMGKAIRVGLMGRTATDEMVDRVIEGCAAALKMSNA
jgi:alanine-glyoxylate transaminase/serine-glyoxylate transaminase/serine-pyruvate transaminase